MVSNRCYRLTHAIETLPSSELHFNSALFQIMLVFVVLISGECSISVIQPSTWRSQDIDEVNLMPPRKSSRKWADVSVNYWSWTSWRIIWMRFWRTELCLRTTQSTKPESTSILDVASERTKWMDKMMVYTSREGRPFKCLVVSKCVRGAVGKYDSSFFSVGTSSVLSYSGSERNLHKVFRNCKVLRPQSSVSVAFKLALKWNCSHHNVVDNLIHQ